MTPVSSEAVGLVEGYASLFGVPDLSNDRVERGAFRDSLRRRGPQGVRCLWQHDAAEPIGVWSLIAEDEKGLRVRGELNLTVRRAREVFALVGQGAVNGLSIGFKAEKARTDPRSGLRRLERIDLWEISLVTFPMLPQARISQARIFAVGPDGATPQKLAGAIRRAAASFDPNR